jgi:hypothetical protein
MTTASTKLEAHLNPVDTLQLVGWSLHDGVQEALVNWAPRQSHPCPGFPGIFQTGFGHLGMINCKQRHFCSAVCDVRAPAHVDLANMTQAINRIHLRSHANANIVSMT